MCTPKAYIQHNQVETLIMEDIQSIVWETPTRFVLRDLIGKTRHVEGRIISMDLITHQIFIEGRVLD